MKRYSFVVELHMQSAGTFDTIIIKTLNILADLLQQKLRISQCKIKNTVNFVFFMHNFSKKEWNLGFKAIA